MANSYLTAERMHELSGGLDGLRRELAAVREALRDARSHTGLPALERLDHACYDVAAQCLVLHRELSELRVRLTRERR